MQIDKKFLFVSGCDRSGTTAIVRLLNEHVDISLGMERYKGLINNSEKLKTLNKSRFEKDNFFNIKEEETNINWDYFYNKLKGKYTDSKYVGDKVPRYFQIYNHLIKEFDSAKHIFIVRDPLEVASSWKVRAEDSKDVTWASTNDVKRSVLIWNKSLEAAYKKLKSKKMDVLFVSYSSLFSGSSEALKDILFFLDLREDEALNSKFEEMTHDWNERTKKKSALTDLEVEYVNQHANFKLCEHALKYSQRILKL